MRIVDLTLPFQDNAFTESTLELASAGTEYTAAVYDFHHDSMTGTYIDFPGHIKETDDGQTADNFPIDKLFRAKAAVIRLDRASQPGGVSGAELEQGFGGVPQADILIINALGTTRFDEIPKRSIYLDKSAVKWIIESGTKLLVSDIFESQSLEGVFYDLFTAGVSTVCEPINLHLLNSDYVKLTVLFPRIKSVTQLPCRIIAEL